VRIHFHSASVLRVSSESILRLDAADDQNPDKKREKEIDRKKVKVSAKHHAAIDNRGDNAQESDCDFPGRAIP